MKPTCLLFLILSTFATAGLDVVTLPEGSADKLGLRVEALAIAPVSDPVRATGRLTLDPLATAVVASPVGGRIESDTLRRGARVKAGDTLLTVRSAERAAAVTTYLDAEQRLRFAKAACEREQALEARKITTTEVLRQREQELALARTAHLSAIQEMYLYGLSEQGLHDMVEDELVRGDLSEQVVTAPIDGVIIDKSTTPGAPVERNAELLRIAALDHLLVEFQVPLRGVGRVREGATVNFQTIVGDAGKGTATISALVPAADATTLAATAMARLENPDGRWIAGTPVEILLDDPDAPKQPAVPTGALVVIDGQRCVFVAETATRFRPHPVEVVAESSERIGVRGLPSEGTRIVTRGAALLLAAWEEAHAAE
jgi:multidrug efflux pump subunit AcrA (membrane-fusion protein)